jgi:hypothetical protein
MANEFIARNGVISKGNVVVTGSLITSGSLTTTGTITATTLIVQTITSSISSITGSTNFGSLSSNTHTFTGSMLVTGSVTSNGLITFTSANNGRIFTSTGATTGYQYAEMINTGGNLNIGVASSTGAIWGSGNGGAYNSAIGTANATDFVIGTNNTGRMIITSGGNVGIGTTSPDNLLVVSGGTGTMKLEATTTNRSAIQIFNTANTLYLGIDNAAASYFGYVAYSANIQTLNYPIIFSNGSGAPTEKIRITTLGYTKMTNNGTFINATGPYHEMWSNTTNNEIVVMRNASASPYGLTMQFNTATPNGGSNWFIYCEDQTAQRFSVRSNGGIYNYSANNSNLSDIRTKKDIIPCESYWNKFKNIEIVKFKYIDQSHDDYNIGVIAQQVESIAPEFIDEDNWSKPDEEPKIMKSIYTEDLHHATIKVLQAGI